MKNLILTLLFFMLFFTTTQAQTQKGNLLLEGTISGSWTSIALTDNTTFGYYLNDNLAITLGFNIGVIESDNSNFKLGTRYHFNEQTLAYADLGVISEEFAISLGLGYRFYANDWMALEPRVGLATEGDALLFKTDVNVSLFFNKP